jgi:hypothetical protein
LQQEAVLLPQTESPERVFQEDIYSALEEVVITTTSSPQDQALAPPMWPATPSEQQTADGPLPGLVATPTPRRSIFICESTPCDFRARLPSNTLVGLGSRTPRL